MRTDAYLERQLLQALLTAPEHRNEVRTHLSPGDFHDPACRALAEAIWNDVPPEGADAAALERELIASAAEGLDWAAVIRGGVHRMRVRQLERVRKDVQQQLLRVQRDRPGDAAAGVELLNEYQRLTEAIRALDRAELTPRGGTVLPPN